MRKSDAALAFKYSEYWEFIKYCTQRDHLELFNDINGYLICKDCEVYRKILDDKYKDLLNTGVVKFIEIKPVPEWFNI